MRGLPHAKTILSLEAHTEYDPLPKKKRNMIPLILGLHERDLFYGEVSSGSFFIHQGCDGRGSWKNVHDTHFRLCNPVFRHMAKK
jgi:hypothetical protein